MKVFIFCCCCCCCAVFDVVELFEQMRQGKSTVMICFASTSQVLIVQVVVFRRFCVESYLRSLTKLG